VGARLGLHRLGGLDGDAELCHEVLHETHHVTLVRALTCASVTPEARTMISAEETLIVGPPLPSATLMRGGQAGKCAAAHAAHRARAEAKEICQRGRVACCHSRPIAKGDCGAGERPHQRLGFAHVPPASSEVLSRCSRPGCNPVVVVVGWEEMVGRVAVGVPWAVAYRVAWAVHR
jgi:hypothetical protein